MTQDRGWHVAAARTRDDLIPYANPTSVGQRHQTGSLTPPLWDTLPERVRNEGHAMKGGQSREMRAEAEFTGATLETLHSMCVSERVCVCVCVCVWPI